MSDESGRNPGAYNDVPIIFNNPFDAVRGDKAADNNIISKTFGIRFIHYMCVPDPLYQNKVGEVRHSFDHASNQQFLNNDRFHQENGFIYVRRKHVFGTFQSNSKDFKNVVAGLYGDSGAMLSLTRYYENTDEPIRISENDKLIPCEIPREFYSVNWEKFQHNPTGIDRLQFKADCVEFLIDSDGIQYFPESDFNIENGYIKWVDGGSRPGLNTETGMGKVCAIRYTYQPYYYVKTSMHDIRIRPSIEADGSIAAKAGPILVMVQADWVYLDRRTSEESDPAAQLEEGTGENTGPR